MQQVKTLLKRIAPSSLRRPIMNFYHLLQAVAANIRYGFPARGSRVIMVTGTNGKTTTVALIAEVLAAAGHKVGVISTAFYRFGDETEINTSSRTVDDVFKVQALLMRMRQADCDMLVIEVTSQALDQHRLWGVPCDVAVMTNLTQDHLDYHRTMERYAAAKGRLFARNPEIIVLNRDDEWFDYFNMFDAERRKVTYGAHEDATCRLAGVNLHTDGSDIDLEFEGEHHLKLHTALPGKFNVYNVAAAATVGYYLMLEPEQIASGIAAVKTVAGRLERVDAGQPFQVIVDYAHTPDALKNLLETLRHMTKGKLWLVFGSAGDRDKAKRPIMGEIAAKLADKIILTDDEPYNEDPAVIRQAIMAGIEQGGGAAKTEEIADRRSAMEKAIRLARLRDTVAIAGMGHEQFRMVAGERQPWNDAAVAKEILQSTTAKTDKTTKNQA